MTELQDAAAPTIEPAATTPPPDPGGMRTWVLVVACIAAAVVAVFGISVMAGLALGREDVSNATLKADVERLSVRGDAGDVTIVASPDELVHVRAVAHYLTERPSVEPQLQDGVLRLDGDCGDWWLLGGCTIDYRVAVPAGTSVEVRIDAGDVSVMGVDSPELRVASDAGDVHVKLYGVPSLVDITSDAGDVHVEVPDAPYALDADADAGDVDVDDIRTDAGASSAIHVRTDAGDIHIEPVGS